jgi:hypothetical protein
MYCFDLPRRAEKANAAASAAPPAARGDWNENGPAATSKFQSKRSRAYHGACSGSSSIKALYWHGSVFFFLVLAL